MSSVINDNEVRTLTGRWDSSELPSNVKLGTDVYLERRASFARYRSNQAIGLSLGDRVTVYSWAEFNVDPSGSVEVGDDSVLVGPIFMCAESIRLGRRVIVSYRVTIADSDFHPVDPVERRLDAIANSPAGDRAARPPVIAKPIVIEDDVWIGIGAIILKGVRIGIGARIGAGAVVTKDVPAHTRVSGNPSKIDGPVTQT